MDLTTQEKNSLAKAERRLQAIAQSRNEGITKIAEARAKLAQAERDAVERGDLKSKALTDARREVLDLESTQRVIEEFLENATNDLREVRAQIWRDDRARLLDTWTEALKATSKAVGAAVQAIEKQRAIEQEAARVLGGGEIPNAAGGNTYAKLREFASTIARTLEKHTPAPVGK